VYEQREHGRVAVALTLRARAQPYSIQIETSDNKLDGFFRALLNGQGSAPGKTLWCTWGVSRYLG